MSFYFARNSITTELTSVNLPTGVVLSFFFSVCLFPMASGVPFDSRVATSVLFYLFTSIYIACGGSCYSSRRAVQSQNMFGNTLA